jgi:hypothetical protein
MSKEMMLGVRKYERAVRIQAGLRWWPLSAKFLKNRE